MLKRFLQKVHSIINILNFRVSHSHTDLGHRMGKPPPVAPDHTVLSSLGPAYLIFPLLLIFSLKKISLKYHTGNL